MSVPGEFSLRWNSYLSQVTAAFSSLRCSEQLVDVTLYCDGGKISGHRVLLAACSSFFRQLFADTPCSHPVIVFRNVRYDDLCSVLTFMYKGEVHVPQEHLASFLTTAELLQVRGLTDEADTLHPVQIVSDSVSETPAEPEHVPTETAETEVRAKKRKLNSEKNETHKECLKQEATEICTDEDVREENSSSSVNHNFEYVANVQELKDVENPPDKGIPPDGTSDRTENIQGADKYEVISNNDNIWRVHFDDEKPYNCTQCNKSFKHPMSLRQHLKIHSGKTKCEYCAKVLSRVRELQIHKNLIHGINI